VNKTVDEAVVLARRAMIAAMEQGPLLTMSFNYETHTSDDLTSSEYALDHVLDMLAGFGVHATFQCPARMAETTPQPMVRIARAGHDLCCCGYNHETAAEVEGPGFNGALTKARVALTRRNIHAIGLHPPVALKDPALYPIIARNGFRYVSELSREDNPRLLIDQPAPLIKMPIASNDSGYTRHPENPKHVYEKHEALIQRVIRKQHYLALNYHLWVLGDRRERLDQVRALLKMAIDGGVKIRSFAEALPPDYRPATWLEMPDADDEADVDSSGGSSGRGGSGGRGRSGGRPDTSMDAGAR
jgi:peptidoglycan/xylan/chitin deacetylase (PgdA/CDA1 family)